MRCLVACAVLTLCLGGSAFAEEPAKQPNILFIFSDDHACDAIGAYGGWLAPLNPTPNIDRLASSGALFKNSFCTNSICGPSRAVILTGKHSHINGFFQNSEKFDPTQWVFPRELQSAGYQTAIVGKWHLGCDPDGFDFWRVLPGQGAYYNPRFLTPNGPEVVEGHCTQIVTDTALDWLKQRDEEKPFLLMCQHKAPHRNWMPDPRDLQRWADTTIPEPDSLLDPLDDNASPALASEMSIDVHMHPNYDLFLDTTPNSAESGHRPLDESGQRNLKRLTPAQREAWQTGLAAENARFEEAAPDSGPERVRLKHQRYVKNYLRTAYGVDRSVGQLLDYLEESGLADNTIVVYSSDQGFYLGEHGWYDKRWMYEQSLRMPLIVRWPGVTQPGQVVEPMVQNLDYAPTFLEAAGAAAPDDLQGASLASLLRGQTPEDWRDSLYYHYYEFPGYHMVARHRGVRTDRYKLMHFYRTGEWEFYDLQADPQEMNNQYNNPAHAEKIAELKAELNRLAEACQDTTDLSLQKEPSLTQ